ncbi:otolin-1-A-like isoform X2 [Xenia sp. Carnegie-2017]|nr:otolin-1-A-like isoform X2 [Xenia sp. Carnegie-2017]
MYMSLQKQSENLDINPTEEVRLPSIKIKDMKENLCCGIKGKRGRPGKKGDDGLRGKIGPQGMPGQAGENGEKGEKGDMGISTIIYQNLTKSKDNFPFIHMVGDGRQYKNINNVEAIAVSFWIEDDKAGDIRYNNGYLFTNKNGYYYIYSQMEYCGNVRQDRKIGHTMSINNKKVLRTTLHGKTTTTHHLGGVFKLSKGDKISISPVVTNIPYCFAREDAYFGAFLVRE